MPSWDTLVPSGYGPFLDDLKTRIRAAQIKAALSVNRELVLLYWGIGRDILQRQESEGWGAKVIERLSRDLRKAFPEMRGFSPRNLKYMRSFAAAWSDREIVQQVAAQIPWFHSCVLLDKLTIGEERLWYARAAYEYGWSRAVLIHQIETGLYRRQGKAITNFPMTLPSADSDLARETLKDPYVFDFLSLGPEAQERELEKALLAHIRDFLLDLGVGFAFIGSHYHLNIGGQNYFTDLLFYHTRLRRYIVIDLKIGGFRREFADKMSFYLSAADDLLRHAQDEPSIGIILCKFREEVVVEYVLRDIRIRSNQDMPSALRQDLPEIEKLEAELREPDEGDLPYLCWHWQDRT